MPEACPDHKLSRGERNRLDKKVHAETGLHLDRILASTCSQGRYISAYGETRHAEDPDGAEHWKVTDCEFGRDEGWDCRYVLQRILRVRGRWREDDARVFISPDTDAVVARKRLDEALDLATTLDAQAACEPDDAAAQHLLELQSDLAYPWGVWQWSVADGRFTLWTTRYAVHFTAESPGSTLHARCWRPRKQFECVTTLCPA